METLVFSSTDIVYKQTLKDIKVLSYDYPIINDISNEFEKRFKDHICAIYNNAPVFFKRVFMNTQNGFKKYQKYYFLLFLIKYCESHEVNSSYKSWTSSRQYDSVEYLLKDPYPNELYNVDYEEIYNKLIFPNDFRLSIMKDIKENVVKHEKRISEETIPSVVVELASNYLELKDDGKNHLMFDYSRMTNSFGAISIDKQESLNTVFNKYSNITLNSFTLSPHIYNHLEKYNNVYVVFPTINGNAGIVSGISNAVGGASFCGRFEKDNDKLKFIPSIRSISYAKKSCSVKTLRFYITTNTNEVIPYKNIQHLKRNEIINIPFTVNSVGDTVAIHTNHMEFKYSLKNKVIRAIPKETSNSCSYVIKRRCNYAMCAGADNILCRFDSEHSYDDLSSFTMSQLFSNIAGYHIAGDKSKAYNLSLKKLTPTYYIIKNDVDAGSAIYNHYVTTSNIIKESIGFESYAKGVLCSYGESRKLEGGLPFVKYLLSVADACVIYKEFPTYFEVVSINELPKDPYGLHLRILMYSKKVIDNIQNTNEIVDSEYYKLHICNTNEFIFVKLNEKFMLNPDGEIYTLSNDGSVYAVDSPKTYALYIANENDVYEVESYEYSNIGDDFPIFNVGESIIKLRLTGETVFDENIKYEIYKNDLPYVQFKSMCSDDRVYAYRIHETDESYVCRSNNGMCISNRKCEYTFDKALNQKYLTVSSDADAYMVLTLS